MAEPIPAATLIVMREQPAGPPELLMVERSAAMRFAGGALVFPGGRVEPGDRLLAEGFDDVDEGAARVAAIRETLEETGVDVGLDQIGQLVPFARWLPPEGIARTFDTRFYLARAPAGAVAVPDGGENVRAFWATAAALLADPHAHLIFPTRRNLERLSRFASFAEAVTDARANPLRTIVPWVEHRGDHLCIPDDLGYPVTSEPLATVRRG
jgi:8-oxo-dGTP pyrophosphatase MutT (NUDIX family)